MSNFKHYSDEAFAFIWYFWEAKFSPTMQLLKQRSTLTQMVMQNAINFSCTDDCYSTLGAPKPASFWRFRGLVMDSCTPAIYVQLENWRHCMGSWVDHIGSMWRVMHEIHVTFEEESIQFQGGIATLFDGALAQWQMKIEILIMQ